ncbi:AraC family transcriptional regulator [uncultured Lactobacillus sp.]|uniref:AraC family transcriptional regulator n=1 Tax=uncultured Lactobacillus sp. TaxID=153152 RepID=UPI0025D10E2A|nr:AraC family transcriptional regulator [uncultured Lactobacillus sp.]
MKEEILQLLRSRNMPREWEDVIATIAKNGNLTKEIGRIGKEPVYRFFETYTDDLVLNNSSISITVQPTKSFIPYHIHNYVEIMIPLVEDCFVYVERTKIKVKQNNLIFMGNKTVHKVSPISSKGVVVNIALRSSAFSLNDLDFLHHKKNGTNISNILFSLLSDEEYGEGRYNLFDVKANPKIIALIYDIIYEYYHPDIQSNQLIRLEMLTLFSRLIRQANYSGMTVKEIRKQKNNLLSLLLYIEKNYEKITLQEMANYFGFNPNYLSDFLKKHTGKTFIQLVHLQRVNVAAEYLSYTVAPIDRIANKVGYENPSYFYKIFKKYFGVSPAEYRHKNS